MQENPLFDAGILTGREQTFAAIACQCRYAQAISLRDIRESRGYESTGLSWEEFCTQHARISRVTAESMIRRLKEFGEAYFRLAAITRISDDTFRQIADRVTPETIDLDGEQIPLTAENAHRIRTGVQRLREEISRAHRYFRTPSKFSEHCARLDDVLKYVRDRAKLAGALSNEELAHLRNFAAYAVDEWCELRDLLNG
jgi:hypothetical protein